MLPRLAADAVVVIHALFVVFVVLGWILVLKWPRLAWVHLPCAAWGALIEFAGWVCPLTPLENRLREAAGNGSYNAGFVEHYVFRFLYPEGLARSHQIVLGTLVVGINLAAYWWLIARRRTPGAAA
jgi:hypothetical protein